MWDIGSINTYHHQLRRARASRPEQTLYPEEAWFDESRFFLLAGQVVSGMSGGAVLNKDGQIIGSMVARTRSDDAIILKSSFLSAELRKKFNAAEFAENFTCATSIIP
ncbi:MAG: hypothetical protein WA160_11365 [Pseudobdellovibrio sp.]